MLPNYRNSYIMKFTTGACAVVSFPGSDHNCGEVAGVCEESVAVRDAFIHLTEEDVPGASLNGRDPSQLHVEELKRWLKCRGAMVSGRKKDLVKS